MNQSGLLLSSFVASHSCAFCSLFNRVGKRFCAFFYVLCVLVGNLYAQKINREAVVRRHTIHIDKIDSLSSLSVGNGNFAFTVDATGMQSFPDAYAKGVPLGTQSVWGWHSFPNTENLKIEQAQKT